MVLPLIINVFEWFAFDHRFKSFHPILRTDIRKNSLTGKLDWIGFVDQQYIDNAKIKRLAACKDLEILSPDNRV